MRRAQHRLVRPEVADVVARPQHDAGLVAPRLEAREQREQLEQIVGLQQHLGLVGGAPHRDGELDLPGVPADRDDRLEHVGQLRHRQLVDLRVDRHAHAGGAQVRRSLERGAVRAGHAAQAIVRRLVAVDRHADALQAGFGGGAGALRRHPAAARRHRALHARGADGADDLQPVVAQVRLAADDRHLEHAELGHLPHQIQALLRRQLVGPRAARARAAVPAGEVALQRDLPDGVDRTVPAIDVARLRRQRQVAQAALRPRRERQRSARRRIDHGVTPFAFSHATRRLQPSAASAGR